MTSDLLQKRLSDNIKELRKNKFTQETLAEVAGISWQMMNGIEGCRKWPSENTLVKLANALNVDVHELFVPTHIESDTMHNTYDVITQKVIAQVKSAVDKALSELQN